MQCKFIGLNNQQCGGNALVGSDFCFYHSQDPEIIKIRGDLIGQVEQPEDASAIKINNNRDAIGLLNKTVTELSNSEISEQKANSLCYLINTSMKALEQDETYTRYKKIADAVSGRKMKNIYDNLDGKERFKAFKSSLNDSNHRGEEAEEIIRSFDLDSSGGEKSSEKNLQTQAKATSFYRESNGALIKDTYMLLQVIYMLMSQVIILRTFSGGKEISKEKQVSFARDLKKILSSIEAANKSLELLKECPNDPFITDLFMRSKFEVEEEWENNDCGMILSRS